METMRYQGQQSIEFRSYFRQCLSQGFFAGNEGDFLHCQMIWQIRFPSKQRAMIAQTNFLKKYLQQLIMSQSLCEHILTLKLQKVANHFAKAGKACTGNKKHSGAALGLCISCGEVRCNSILNECSYQHSYGTKHPLIYKMDQQSIYCFSCKQNVGEIWVRSEQSKKKEKIMQVYEKLMKLSEKLEEKAEIEVIKVQKKKREDKQFQKQTKQQFKLLKKEESQSGTEKKKYIKLNVFGLGNLGNTCFFNSILQSLFACQQLHQKYQQFHPDTHRQFGRVGQINILMKKYLQNNEKCFSPKSLFAWTSKTKGMYRHLAQQDAQEFLVLILNGLIDGERFWQQIKPVYGQKITISEKLFGFFLASRLECLSCQKVSWCLDFSLELAVQLNKISSKSFPLPAGDISPQQIKMEGLCYPPQKLTDTFLDVFFSAEALTSKNAFTCEGCKTSKAWRKLYIKDPPEVLIISLKRFNNNLSKNNAIIRPPFRLDLEGHCLNKGPLVYEIFAISEHSGSAHGGHYVAYSRRGGDWYYFSDSNVKAQTWQKVRMSQPYILFYKRIQ